MDSKVHKAITGLPVSTGHKLNRHRCYKTDNHPIQLQFLLSSNSSGGLLTDPLLIVADSASCERSLPHTLVWGSCFAWFACMGYIGVPCICIQFNSCQLEGSCCTDIAAAPDLSAVWVQVWILTLLAPSARKYAASRRALGPIGCIFACNSANRAVPRMCSLRAPGIVTSG